jgi:hypothetical protein
MPGVIVKVVRPFFVEGRALAAGDTVELSASLAAELVSCGKASRERAAAATVPLSLESADALVSTSRRKRGESQ